MTLSDATLRPSPLNMGDLGERWPDLARASGLAADERLCLGLSGGADSVLLLHLIARARPRPALLAVHVDHGLRGAESDADARFCAALCTSLHVPFELRRIALEPSGGSLEERAREARYRALARAARESGYTTLVTGHHADDALETLLLRWMRGSATAGLYGARRASAVPARLGGEPGMRLVRPLATLRREEVRELLSARGLAWREDSSNADPRHARSRVRHGLLPGLARWCGPDGLEHLHAFARAAEELERELARATADLVWRAPRHGRSAPMGEGSEGSEGASGGTLPRSALMRLPRALRRRVLWRLLTEPTGASPGTALLEGLLDDLAAGRCTRHTLPRRWQLQLRSSELVLLPPGLARAPLAAEGDLALAVPGSVRLQDGRRLCAELVEARDDEPLARSPWRVELDARALAGPLSVRLPRAGDRFHALGAPGSKRLTRYLADRGLPREQRRAVPLVFAGEELVWVTGFAPCEARRVRPGTDRRLCLALEPAALEARGTPRPR